MDIIIIPAFFQTKKRPTLGSFFLDQAKALAQAGHQVTVLYCDTYSVKCAGEWLTYGEAADSDAEGIKIYRKKVFCPLKHGMEGYREAFAKGIRELWQERMEKNAGKNPGARADVIHAHCCVWAGYAAMKLSQETGIPYVITEHATLFALHREQISGKNNAYIAEAFQNASKVICVSRAFREVLSEYRRADAIQVIGNVVDCALFTCREEAPAEQDDGVFRFLTVCYMQTQDQLYKKGMDLLFRAWKRVQAFAPAARLVVGGGGQAVSKAVEWCREQGISDTVEFTGALGRKQVAEQMQACDCFVLPGRYETFGVVYIEAMACGKPVIATASGGPDDFVTGDSGILIPVGDEEALVRAMRRMMQDQKNYEPRKIRELAQGSFSPQAIARQLEQVYMDCRNGTWRSGQQGD